jgi:hypothetical protein
LARAAGILFGFAAAMVAGDYALSRVHLPRVEGSTNEILWKWELYAAADPPPDVVILGSSYELFGVAPDVIERHARDRGTPVRVLNLAATASNLVGEYLLARRIVESGRVPRVVYLGITPKAVEDDRYTWSRGGIRAFGELRDLPLVCAAGSRAAEEAVPAALFRSYHQWSDARLIAERLMIGAALRPASKVREHAHGWAEWTGPAAASAPPLSPSGLPDGSPDADSAGESVNAEAARRLVSLLRGAGVEVYFVELPHSSRSPADEDPARNASYRRFRDALASDTGAAVLRPPVGLLADGDYFDEAHLNASGACKVSAWLGGELSRSQIAKAAPAPASLAASVWD